MSRRKVKPLADILYGAKDAHLEKINLRERAQARRASEGLKALAASAPPPPTAARAKSLRDTFPQLRCAMGWALKCRLEFLCKLHGVEMSHLVAALLEESLPSLEALSRERPEFAAEWERFDGLFDEARRQEEAVMAERRRDIDWSLIE